MSEQKLGFAALSVEELQKLIKSFTVMKNVLQCILLFLCCIVIVSFTNSTVIHLLNLITLGLAVIVIRNVSKISKLNAEIKTAKS